MDKKYLIGIIIVIVAVVVVASVASNMANDDDKDGNADDCEVYSFDDAKGIHHDIKVPVEKISVTHKYAPVFLKILGVEDQVAGLDNTYGAQFKQFFPNSFYIGTYSEPDGATMLEHGSKIIISPTTMGLSNEDALKGMGIEVVYLDTTDPENIPDSLENLVQMFGNTSEVRERADTYLDYCKQCDDYVKALDLSSAKDADFALFMCSSGFFHTHTSAACKVIESVAGKSFTRTTDPNPSSSVYFSMDPSELLDFDGKNGLEYAFIYTMDTPEENYDKFTAYAQHWGLDFGNLTCTKEHHVYALATDTVNGALFCVSKLLYASAYGADIGDTAADMVQKFNDTFGLDYQTTDLIVEVA